MYKVIIITKLIVHIIYRFTEVPTLHICKSTSKATADKQRCFLLPDVWNTDTAHLSKEFENTVQSQNKSTVQPKHCESTEAATQSIKLDTVGLTKSSASQS